MTLAGRQAWSACRQDSLLRTIVVGMAETTTIRVTRTAHEDLKRLARADGTTVAVTVARGVRLLRQERMGRDLAAELSDDERSWLDAELG